MKINQFAQLTNVPLAQIQQELADVGFAVAPAPLKEMLWAYLQKIHWHNNSRISLLDHFNQYLVTPTTTLAQFFTDDQPLTTEIFTLIGLQLLGFQVGPDFKAETPQASWQKLGLAPLPEVTDADSLERAWYQLLTTHTPQVLTYLDQLAAQGYFTQAHFDHQHPLYFNGKAQAVFNVREFHYETVFVETDFDSDGDGQNDLLKVEITRPDALTPVPAVYTASPYDQGINEKLGEQLTHDVNVDLQPKPASQFQPQPTAPLASGQAHDVNGQADDATLTHEPHPGYTLNDFLLPRGFASVYAAGIGTIDSDGLQTCGDQYQTASTIAVIEWLHGDRRAFTNRTDGITIKADWCNGSVGMTGRSYLGTLAIAAATTGVPGLKTIIPEAAISSWYDYYRENGLVVAPGGFQGEDADVLAGETFSRSLRAGDEFRTKAAFTQQLQSLQTGQERQTGNYNQFWDDRNYRNHDQQVQADVLLVHGLNDWNVKLKNAGHFWQDIQALPISKKLILHQGQHMYLNAFPSFDYSDLVNLWLSNKLAGVENGVDVAVPAVIVQDNVTPETWHAQPNWLTKAPTEHVLQFNRQHWTQSYSADQFHTFSTHPEQWEQKLLSLDDQELDPQRTVALLNLDYELTINGTVTIDVAVSSDQPVGMLSAVLLDVGEARRLQPAPTVSAPRGLPLGYQWYRDDIREFQLEKFPSDHKIISRVHLNLQNRTSPAVTEPIAPGKFSQLHLDFQPVYYHLPKDRRLAVVLYATDFMMTNRNRQAINYQLQPASVRLQLPEQ
ncbi:Xaa-Pro dipeptidyl-peptidase [Fructilactobacillus cliffordii]|uniref:Xaa-Pro dipeptidyl-peptidase n=1 Tax=Fructilactobacillus cliffordii TaxID=2940299 RepID=UPI00209261D5|nr:Xaa-Pro dipeptidyl-peptidase [Fructilactobacillus cliffordii]USS86249.1 Xaa-Pro dipeptidyl-peptidase [Fructilactobacillus cliffordii]